MIRRTVLRSLLLMIAITLVPSMARSNDPWNDYFIQRLAVIDEWINATKKSKLVKTDHFSFNQNGHWEKDKRGQLVRGYTHPAKKKEELDLLSKLRKGTVEAFHSGEIILPGFTPADMKPGAVGWLLHAEQNGTRIRVEQIIDDSNCLVYEPHSEESYWLSGYDTKQLVDDSVIETRGFVKLIGTRRYSTVVGSSRQVYEIQFADHEPLVKQLKEDMWKERSRTWKAGPHETTAWLGSIDGNFATLIKQDGTAVKVPIDKLSDADQNHIGAEVQRRKSLSESAALKFRMDPGWHAVPGGEFVHLPTSN
jgi:hypothetical protein